MINQSMNKTKNQDPTKSILHKPLLSSPDSKYLRNEGLVYLLTVSLTKSGKTVYTASDANLSSIEKNTFVISNVVLGCDVYVASARNGKVSSLSTDQISSFKLGGVSLGMLTSDGKGGYKIGDSDVMVIDKGN